MIDSRLPDGQQFLSVEEFCKLTGKNPQSLRRVCRQWLGRKHPCLGKISKVGSRFMIPRPVDPAKDREGQELLDEIGRLRRELEFLHETNSKRDAGLQAAIFTLTNEISRLGKALLKKENVPTPEASATPANT